MKTGVPPTEPKARTGELTPPGRIWLARANSSADLARLLPDSISCLLAGVGQDLK